MYQFDCNRQLWQRNATKPHHTINTSQLPHNTFTTHYTRDLVLNTWSISTTINCITRKQLAQDGHVQPEPGHERPQLLLQPSSCTILCRWRPQTTRLQPVRFLFTFIHALFSAHTNNYTATPTTAGPRSPSPAPPSPSSLATPAPRPATTLTRAMPQKSLRSAAPTHPNATRP